MSTSLPEGGAMGEQEQKEKILLLLSGYAQDSYNATERGDGTIESVNNYAISALTQLIQERERLARVDEIKQFGLSGEYEQLHTVEAVQDYFQKRLASLLKGGADA